MAVSDLVILVALVVAAALAWAMYFCFKDRCEPDSRRLFLVVFLAGAVSTGLAWLLYVLVEMLGFASEFALEPRASTLARLLYFVLVVGTIEETCKFLSVRWFIGRHSLAGEPLQALLLAATAGLGFASVENLVLGRFLEGPELWGRIVASPLTHALFAAVWGHALALELSVQRSRAFRVAAGLAAASVLHGIYDLFVLSPGFGRLVAAGVILMLWLAFFVVVAGMLRRSPRKVGAGSQA